MRTLKSLPLTALGILLSFGPLSRAAIESKSATPVAVTPAIAVAPKYDSIHVYVAPQDVDRFVASFLGTFGGHGTKPVVVTVTPTPSSAVWQFLQTPVGAVSVFGYKTPVPFPFGAERTGYLVKDMDVAIIAARNAGADVLVSPFRDAIGRDSVIQFPGGINTQLYWHIKSPSSSPLQTIPENRVYISPDAVEAFLRSFLAFSHGRIVSDDRNASGIEIGSSGHGYRRIHITSNFGKMTVFVTDGQLPYPYGRETTGFQVASLADTLPKAKALGVVVLVKPYTSDGRNAAIVEFPGGYIAEIHSSIVR